MAKLLSSNQKIVSTKEYTGVRVVGARKKNDKRIGKVGGFVFHPTEKRVVGFIVKRPDLLLMFHRKDSFVALDGFHIEDDRVMINDDKAATGNAAVKRLGLDWDNCVLWLGMPVVTKSQQMLGYVGSVLFDIHTGEVESLEVETGAINDAIVGRMTIPADMVKGFKRGVGAEIAPMDERGAAAEVAELGAILVDDAAAEIKTEGGAAAAAGEATAVAADKARKAVDNAKPKVQEAKQATEAAVEKGIHATGKQIGKAQGMFGAFKDEYNKALSEGSDGEPAAQKQVAAPKKAATKSAEKAATKSAEKPAAKPKSATASKPAAKPASKSAAKTSAKPAAKKAASKSSDDVAKSIGQHLGKTKGMFAAFKEEFDKASKED